MENGLESESIYATWKTVQSTFYDKGVEFLDGQEWNKQG